VLSVLAVIGIYVAVVLTYALGGRSDEPDDRQPAANGALVYLDLDAVSGKTSSLQTRASVYPGVNLLNGEGELRDALTVEVTPAASADTLTFAGGSRVGSQPVSLFVDGDIGQWPFDSYQWSDVQVLVYTTTPTQWRASPRRLSLHGPNSWSSPSGRETQCANVGRRSPMPPRRSKSTPSRRMVASSNHLPTS
jgi:hypothetical protein